MAQRPDIQYIRFYTDGSAARQPAPVSYTEPHRKPRAKKQKQTVLYIDPLAILGVAAAVVLLIMMVVGLVNFYNAQHQLQVMESYVQQLTQKNQQLQEQYDNGYDLEEIQKIAEALGMIPKEEAESITIHIPAPEATPEPTFWEKIGTFLSGLFA